MKTRHARGRMSLIGLASALVYLLLTPGLSAQLSVVMEERVFADPSRPTPPNESFLGAPDRTLRTLLWSPTGSCGGSDPCPPYPLLLMAHGLGGLPERFEAFATTIAEGGYVVAAPAFPLTNPNAPGNHESASALGDVANQPEDLAFVAGELLVASATPADSLFGSIDPNAIVALGHSLGGVTVQGLAHSDCCAVLPLRATILASTPGLIFLFGWQSVQTGPASLVLHGTADTTFGFDAAAPALFALLPPPRFLVGILGAGHSEALESQVEPPIPARATAQQATLSFLNAQLRGAEDELEEALEALAADGHIVVTALCGNGAFDPGEVCDDGNTLDGDGCSALCLVEGGGIPVLPESGVILFAVLLLGTSMLMVRHRLRSRI